jgi:two-component system, NarL family, invasion response regulator UvrY
MAMKILIADDHAIVRRGLIQILLEEFPQATVKEVSNGSEALTETRAGIWDIILMDISMPGRNGIEILKQMRAENVKAPVLMLSMHPEEQYAVRSLRAGASGFLNKESATAELLAAVHRVLSGRKYITDAVAEILADSANDHSDKASHELLSDREMQVLLLIASGKTVSEIGQEISLSVNTISTYRSRILEKMNLQNNAELTRYVFENHLN